MNRLLLWLTGACFLVLVYVFVTTNSVQAACANVSGGCCQDVDIWVCSGNTLQDCTDDASICPLNGWGSCQFDHISTCHNSYQLYCGGSDCSVEHCYDGGDPAESCAVANTPTSTPGVPTDTPTPSPTPPGGTYYCYSCAPWCTATAIPIGDPCATDCSGCSATNTPTPPSSTSTPTPTPTPNASTLSCGGVRLHVDSNTREYTDLDPLFSFINPLTDRSPTLPPGNITDTTYSVVHHVNTVLENLKTRVDYDGDYALKEVYMCFTSGGKSACIGTGSPQPLDKSWNSRVETNLEWYSNGAGSTSMIYSSGGQTYFSYDSIRTSLMSQGVSANTIDQDGITWRITVRNTQNYQCNGPNGLISLINSPPIPGETCNVSNTCRGILGKKPDANSLTGPNEVQIGSTQLYTADFENPLNTAGITFFKNGVCADNVVLQTSTTTAGTQGFSWTPSQVGPWTAYVRSVRNWNAYSTAECRGASACVSGFNVFSCTNPDTNNDTILNITVEDADWYKLVNTSFHRQGDITNYIPDTANVIDFGAYDDGSDQLIVGNGGVVTSTGTVALNQTPVEDYLSGNGWYSDNYSTSATVDIPSLIENIRTKGNVNTISTVSDLVSDSVNYATNTITFSSPSDLGGLSNVVLIVDGGDIVIDDHPGNIGFNTSSPDSIMLITTGEIKIHSDIQEANAIFIANSFDLAFDISVGSTVESELLINGNLVSATPIGNVTQMKRVRFPGSDPSQPIVLVVFDQAMYSDLFPYVSTKTSEGRVVE